jgi:hypothetical protein
MELKEILNNYIERLKEKPKLHFGEWQELIGKFTSVLDGIREQNGFKKLGAKFYSIKMAQAKLTTKDLYWFYRYCEDAKDFSKTWWWSLKAK